MFYFECETGICSGHYQASLFASGGFIIRCENFSGKTCFPVLLYPPEASGGYFALAFATPPPRVERFSALTL